MKKTILFTILILSLLLVYGCGQKTSSTDEIIKIGFMGPLTGGAANLGVSAKDAVSLAVEEINNAGGVNGKKIEVIYEDSKCEPKEATNTITKLATVDKVPVVLGGLCSGETFTATPVAEQNKVVMLSYCSSAPKITNAGDFIFRNYPSDAYQGVYAAEYAFNEMKAKKAAVLHVNNEWGNGIKDTFTKKFKELGGEITTIETHEQDAADLKTQLTKIKETAPDVIYTPTHPPETITLLKQAKELGLDATKFVGADGSFDPEVAKKTIGFGDGYKASVPAVEFSKEKSELLKSKYGHDITVCGVQAYDAAKIIAKVMSEVGTDSTKIKDALYKVSYKGESGLIEFDENGDPKTAEYKLMEIKNGEWVKVK